MPRKKPSKKTMRRRLDNVVRDYVKLRDQNTCQICYIHKDSTPLGTLDWSHYISRRYAVIRWDQRNSIACCRKCHQQYGDGINKPHQETVNRIWGKDTALRLEKIAMQYQTIKGTPLDTIDFRLKLELYYKKLIKLLEEGMNPKECISLNYSEESCGIFMEEKELECE